jgi:putative ATP-dependent endonuclease of the OLD family
MRIASIRIQGYRCIDDLTVKFDDLTVLIGANGAGKSSLLYALEWFFSGGALDEEDLSGHDPEGQVSVGVTFVDFTDADREVLGSYLVDDEATFWRTWSPEDGDKLTGRGLAYPPFEDVRGHEKAMDLRNAYGDLSQSHPELDLPPVSSRDAAIKAMEEWEEGHQSELKPASISATHLFGFTGGPRLAGRFDFVLVRAVVNAEEETRDGRGTLLRQLLDRSTADQEAIERRISEIGTQFGEQIDQVVEEEHRPALAGISERVSEGLSRLVDGGSVALNVAAPELRMPPLEVGMRVSEDGVETEVGRQGHGFQRALLISIVQELARLDDDSSAADGPALFLAFEEPELYQHPLQARHFSSVLAALPRSGMGAIQIAYATHNEHFVEPTRFERLRRFQKRREAQSFPTASAISASVEQVAERLHGLMDASQIPKRIEITVRRTLAEALFARAVLLTEGYSDAALLAGLGDRDGGGFDAEGIAIVPAGGKSRLLVPWAVLMELEIPVFTVFDGDSGAPERIYDTGGSATQIDAERDRLANENRDLLGLLGAEPQDFPSSHIAANYAVFEDRVEATLESAWPEVLELTDEIAEEQRDWRSKPEDALREAARTCAGLPAFFAEMIDAVRACHQG